MPDGSIQAEWHENGYDVEIVFSDTGPTDLFVCDIASGEEAEFAAPISTGDLRTRLAVLFDDEHYPGR